MNTSIDPIPTADILVALPTLGDRLQYLQRTLESIREQRADVTLRLVVVCPPNAHEARKLALDHGAHIVDDPARGLSAAVNAALEARAGERYWAWLGDDDLFLPGGLSRLKLLIEEDSRAVVAYGGCSYIDEKERELWVSAAGPLAAKVLPWGPNLIPNPASLIDLDSIVEVGGFDDGLRLAMDLDLFLRLRRHGSFRSTRRAVSAFRWHQESLTVANRQRSAREANAVRRRYLPRPIRPMAPVWEWPVSLASSFAARQVARRAASMRQTPPD